MDISDWPNADQELFDHALELKNSGNIREAKEIMRTLCERHPERAGLFYLLGHLHWKLNELALAQEAFQRATDLAPTTESASLGLFHVLWNRGVYDEALKEARRFLSVRDSSDYREIIAEINSLPEGRLDEKG